jgi:cysteine sulfinate desulfinase/cysteine desulfurase-like protein
MIKMITEAYQLNIGKKPHVVTSQLENYNTLQYIRNLENNNYITATFITPTVNGVITAKSVKDSLTANTCLVSIIYADNIIGVYSNIPEIARIVSKYKNAEDFKIPFHTDMGFLFSKYKINLKEIKNKSIDAITISFDCVGGPKGIGMLLIKKTLVDGFGLNIIKNNNINIAMIAGGINSLKYNFANRLKKNKHLLRLKVRFIKNIKRNFTLIDFIDFIDTDPINFSTKLKKIKNKKKDKKSRKIILLGALNFEEKILPNMITILIPNMKTEKKKIYDYGILALSVLKEEIMYLNIADHLKNKIIRISYADNCTNSDIDFLTKKLNIIFD